MFLPQRCATRWQSLRSWGFWNSRTPPRGVCPSQEGYREFVDALMQPETLTEAEKLTIDAMLAKSAFDPERLLRGAAKTLAASTRYLALSTTPSGADAKIKAVQFVQTSRRTAMLIMMSSAGTMKNKVFHCDFDLSNEIMRIFFRVLNERVTGRDVAEINRAFGAKPCNPRWVIWQF